MTKPQWMLSTIRAADLPDLHDIDCQSPAPWSSRQLEVELTTPGGCQLLCRHPDGRLAGFLLARITLDEAEILKIATARKFHRCGVARLLLHSFIATAEKRQALRIHLELRAANAPALALYQKFAFEMTGRRANYYTSPSDDALCLTKFLERKTMAESTDQPR